MELLCTRWIHFWSTSLVLWITYTCILHSKDCMAQTIPVGVQQLTGHLRNETKIKCTFPSSATVYTLRWYKKDITNEVFREIPGSSSEPIGEFKNRSVTAQFSQPQGHHIITIPESEVNDEKEILICSIVSSAGNGDNNTILEIRAPLNVSSLYYEGTGTFTPIDGTCPGQTVETSSSSMRLRYDTSSRPKAEVTSTPAATNPSNTSTDIDGMIHQTITWTFDLSTITVGGPNLAVKFTITTLNTDISGANVVTFACINIKRTTTPTTVTAPSSQTTVSTPSQTTVSTVKPTAPQPFVLSTGAIVGIVIGSLLLAVAVIIIIFLVCRYLKKREGAGGDGNTVIRPATACTVSAVTVEDGLGKGSNGTSGKGHELTDLEKKRKVPSPTRRSSNKVGPDDTPDGGSPRHLPTNAACSEAWLNSNIQCVKATQPRALPHLPVNPSTKLPPIDGNEIGDNPDSPKRKRKKKKVPTATLR